MRRKARKQGIKSPCDNILTETARALRALFLNIVGDTKTEIDEGVTWTTGEIAGLRDVIKIYAKDAYDAAQATGSIIDPMRAMEGLSKSLKDGVLTEAQLMEMVSDIGGKLRTSQLLALINNWDMYESMLNDYRNAAGSADKEIENAMDSWTRKSNVLKNTWTEFVKTGLDSKLFKGALDTLTAFVERLGTLEGTVARIGPFLAALKLSSMAKGLKNINDESGKFSKFLDGIGVSARGLSIAAGAVTALGVAWSVISYAIEDAKRKHEEQVQAQYETAKSAAEETENLKSLLAELENAQSGTDDFNEAANALAYALGTTLPDNTDASIKKLKELTEAELEAKAAAIEAAKYTAEMEYLAATNDALYGTGLSLGNRTQLDWRIASGTANEDVQAAWAKLLGDARFYSFDRAYNGDVIGALDITDADQAVEYRKALEEVVQTVEVYAARTKDAEVYESALYKTAKQFLADTSGKYQDLATQNEYLAKITGEVAEKTGEAAEAANEAADAISNQTQSLYANQAALKDDATAEERLTAAKKDAEAAARRLIPALFDENGQLSATGIFAFEADKKLAGMVQSELEAQLAAKQANYSTLVTQLAMVGITAGEAAKQVYAISRALAGDNPGLTGAFFGAFMASGGGDNVQAVLNAKMAEINRLMSQISTISGYSGTAPSWQSSGSSGSGHSGSSGSGSGSHSSSSASTEDKRLTALKDRVTLLKSELALLQARGASEEEQIAKMKQIQEALHNQADYMRSIHADQADINGLSTEWYNYQDKITDLMDEQAEAAQKQADAMQAVLDAQIALDNALRNNRTTRYYNAETGQWEYGADAGTVEKAREDLNKALENAGMSPEAWALQYSLMNAAAMADSIRHTDGIFRPSYGDVPNIPRGGVTTNNLGGNNYGNTYNIAGVTLTEDQARGTSVYELVRMSRQLAIYGNNY